MSEPSPRQIALYGGSFNPPHVCHTLATVWVLQTQRVDEVWWIPTYAHAFDKALADFDERLTMCELAIRDLAHVRVDTIERELGGESRTIDTVRALKERHPDADFHLVIGADILEETSRWKNWSGLMELVSLIVVGRKGYDKPGTAGIDLELPDISSTFIRDALLRADHDAIRDWVPHRVLDYIDACQLYLPVNDR